MDANTLAAVAAVCAAVVSVATVVGQVALARRVGSVKELVNGQSHTLNRLMTDDAFRAGVESAVRAGAQATARAPRQITPR